MQNHRSASVNLHRNLPRGKLLEAKTPEEEEDGKAAKVSGRQRLLLSSDAATLFFFFLSEPSVIFALKIEQRIAPEEFLKGEARLCFSPDLLW